MIVKKTKECVFRERGGKLPLEPLSNAAFVEEDTGNSEMLCKRNIGQYP